MSGPQAAVEFSDADFDLNPQRNKTDPCIPMFYMRPVQNTGKSEAEGRAIFEDIEYVKIIVPGQRDMMDRRVRTEDIERWPHKYDAFKRKREQPVQGTPLRLWGQMSESRVAEFGALNITTVEQVATLDDAALQRVGPGANELREKAKRFVAASSKAGKTEAEIAATEGPLKDRIAELEREVERLTDMNAGLRARLDAGAEGGAKSAKAPKKRGRPKKKTAEDEGV